MAISKVIYGQNTLIDLTNDTVTSASHIVKGHTGHLADGTQVTGTASDEVAREDIINSTGTTCQLNSGDINSNMIKLLEGTGEYYSDPTVTKLRDNIFRNDQKIRKVNFPNLTEIGGDVFNGDKNIKYAIFPNVTTVGSSAFAGTRALLRASFPAVTTMNAGVFNGSQSLVSCDWGDAPTIGQSVFNDTPCLSELILRRSSGLVGLSNTNGLGTNHMSLVMQKMGYIYIPKILYDHLGDESTLDYASATNWSIFYELNSNLFRKLESYTVDGTATGALDYSKIWTTHTPDYSLENEVFDGTKVIDTNMQLFDGGTGAFTIVFSVTGITTAPSGKTLFSLIDANDRGIHFSDNGNYATSQIITFKPTENSYNGELVQHNNKLEYLGFFRSDGINLIGGTLPADGIWANAANDRIVSLRRSGTVQTMNETLLVGGKYVNGIPTANWKGTIHMFKVYKQMLNMNEIISLLKLEEIYNDPY